MTSEPTRRNNQQSESAQRTVPSKAVHGGYAQKPVIQSPVPPARRQAVSQPQSYPPPQNYGPAQNQSAPQPPAHAAQRPKPQPKKISWKWWLLGAGAIFAGTFLLLLMFIGYIVMLYSSDDILPGVHVLGVDLGGKSKTEAVAALEIGWQDGILVQDGDRQWRVDAQSLGLFLDVESSVNAAYDEGRSSGGTLKAIFGTSHVAPNLQIDLAQARAELQSLIPLVELPAVNAGVRLVNGQVQASPPQEGRILDVDATLALLQQDGGRVLADGVLELVMIPVQPTVFDSSPMVAQAAQLLANPLEIQAYDPITNESLFWLLTPAEWSHWLVATPDASSPTGLALTLDSNLLGNYLESQAGSLGNNRFLKIDESTTSVQNTLASNQTKSTVRIYHHPTQHVVGGGETFSSIAYDYGIPYPWIQQSNPNVGDALSVGQTITIPSPDEMLPLPPVPNKRIVVNISRQRMWAYENDQVKWEWPISTGISSSPTAPGVFQIQSHELNAYAGNWNLWMPHFMGVYRPVPTSDFMNGFHGFPTRGGSQLLWTNNIGSPVTYGCILVSDTNVQQLYSWAEDGVVVEIQR